jgi:prolipoprotein diacylglyceryl transferase
MIHWNAAPEIFHTPFLSLRWYGLLFSGSFFFGYRFTQRAFEAEGKPVALVDRVLVYMLIGTIAGARLGHCLFYEPEIYLADPLRILKVWEGGLASHGALLGIMTSLFIFTRRVPGFTVLQLLDWMCTPVAMAGFFIRTGNLFNSEILGRPADVPWAFVFDRIDQTPRHPVQIYEALSYLAIYFVMNRIFWKTDARRYQGKVFGIFLMLIFGARFVLEFFKDRQVGFEASLPLNMGHLLSIPVVFFGAWLVVRARKLAPSPDPAAATRKKR